MFIPSLVDKPSAMNGVGAAPTITKNAAQVPGARTTNLQRGRKFHSLPSWADNAVGVAERA